MTDNKKKKKVYKFVLTGDLNADWLKYIDDGKYKEADLAAHDYAAKLEAERNKKKDKE